MIRITEQVEQRVEIKAPSREDQEAVAMEILRFLRKREEYECNI